MPSFSLTNNRKLNTAILAFAIAAALLFVLAGRSFAQGPQQLVVPPKKMPILFTILTVTNTDDSGDGSLRNAIESANDTLGNVNINFDISGDGPHTLSPASPYPTIGNSVLINGYTQDGSIKATASTPALLKIELNGANAGDDAKGLHITGSSSTIRGLAVNRFDGPGIYMEGVGSNVIEGNHVGLDVTGTIDLGNDSVGVYIDDSPSNRIGGTTPDDRNVISGNESSGVFILKPGATSNRVLGNYIGTDATGTISVQNWNGLSVSGASDNTIGGTSAGARNVISGNRLGGLTLSRQSSNPATGNLVQGNYIGTNAAGNAALGNGRNGVSLTSTSGNTIGGAEPGAGNVISGNGFSAPSTGTSSSEVNGIHIRGNGFEAGDLVLGNYIGTNAAGNAAIPNRSRGVYLHGASYHTIGGSLTAGTGNVISGHQSCGISFGINSNTGTDPWIYPSDVTIIGNRIGTDATGMFAIGNGCGAGPSGDNTVLGGTGPGQGNLISGNSTGVNISGTSGVRVEGNLIGTDITGNGPLGNTGSGVVMVNGAEGYTVGGTTAGAGNTIAYNQVSGIESYPGHLNSSGDFWGGSELNRVIGNSIYDNAELAIDLGRDGVTANDSGLVDGTPGHFQNYPVLAMAPGESASVTATLQSNASSQFRVEFFSNPACDPNGYGEGRTYLGAQTLTTDGSGSGVVTFATNASLGTYITATATGPSANTSEFSACMVVTAPPAAPVTPDPEQEAPQTELDFGSSGGSEGGSGDFSTSVPKADRAIIGTIPAGIKDLRIDLTAVNDLDIELWDGDTFVVGWESDGQKAQIYSATEITGGYNGVKITWSGWNGVGGSLGNEYIQINGTTANSFVMKAFGYQAGDVAVVYSWEGTGGSGPAASGTGKFSKKISLNDRATIGTIPQGIEDLYIQLTATADLDIELWDGKNFVVGWESDGASAQVTSATETSGKYNGVVVTWSGWNGVGGNRGNEFIRLSGVTGNSFVMKVFAFQAGSVDVVYTWGPGS